MTDVQRNQVAAMNSSGMTIDEIVLDTGLNKEEVELFIAERNNKRKAISETTKKAVIEWYQSGHSEKQALKSAKDKMLAIYETLTPEETRAWEMGEVYAEIVRGLE